MIHIYDNINVASRISFRVNHQAKTVVEFETAEDLRGYFADNNPQRWYVLGAGNNTLFTKDYDGVVLTPICRKMEVVEDNSEYVDIRVEAGADWDTLVEWSVENGLWGVENLSAIPSSVGAAPVQNIGAYGAEIKDVVTAVEYFDCKTLEVKRLTNAECRFAYRDSIFKQELRGVAIILAVEMRLQRAPKPNLGYGDVMREIERLGGVTLRNIRRAISDIRGRKLPDPKELGNAGSFFKNPIVKREVADRLLHEYPSMPHYDVPGEPNKVKLAAGWLIDQSGLKGYREHGVGVHENQALVLVNYGTACGNDVKLFAEFVASVVDHKFGVQITPEVNIL